MGTIDAYYQANMDFLVSDPALDVNEKTWPIYSFQPSFPPPKVTVAAQPSGFVPGGPRLNIIANGTVSEGWLKGTVVGFDCRISAESTVEDSILFDGVSIERGAQVRRAIVDKGVQIRPCARLVSTTMPICDVDLFLVVPVLPACQKARWLVGTKTLDCHIGAEIP